MTLVGVTGGIGAGKTTVLSLFETLGARTLDADAVVHGLYAPGGPVYRAVCRRWGQAVRNEDGSVDRAAIARIVFTPGPARYDANRSRHHHFVCERCGLIRDVDDAQLDDVSPTAEVTRIGRADAVTVQFRGLCAVCQTNEASRT